MNAPKPASLSGIWSAHCHQCRRWVPIRSLYRRKSNPLLFGCGACVPVADRFDQEPPPGELLGRQLALKDEGATKEHHMRRGFFEEHWTNDGNPAGGVSSGRGVAISWQNGPLGRGEHRREPNGAFVEDVLMMCLGRLVFYQTAAAGRFACQENSDAISHLEAALNVLDQRTLAREAQGVEGLHQAHTPPTENLSAPDRAAQPQNQEARSPLLQQRRGSGRSDLHAILDHMSDDTLTRIVAAANARQVSLEVFVQAALLKTTVTTEQDALHREFRAHEDTIRGQRPPDPR